MGKKIGFGLSLVVILAIFFPVRSWADDPPPGSESQDLSVNASVAAKATDYSLNLQSDPQQPIPQDTETEYTITYGSNLLYATDMTITAGWSQGSILDAGQPAYDLLTYVSGSASRASGNTQAVVDPIARTLTWTINSFPAQKTANVTFKLRTNGDFRGANTVRFMVTAQLASGGITLPQVTQTQTYHYQANLYQTPETSPLPSPIVSGSPAPANQSGLTIRDISLNSLTANNLKVGVSTSTEAKLKVVYGKAMNKLDQSFESLEYLKDQEVSFDSLDPETTYYFKITATDKGNNSVSSDIYKIKTPVLSEAPEIQTNTLIITSDRSILFNSAIFDFPGRQTAFVVLPKSQPFEFKFNVSKSSNIKRVQVNMKKTSLAELNKPVLGVSISNNEDVLPNADSTDLVELSAGAFVGRILSPSLPGIYQVQARISDEAGNISEQKVADVRVSENLTVTDQATHTFQHSGIRSLEFT